LRFPEPWLSLCLVRPTWSRPNMKRRSGVTWKDAMTTTISRTIADAYKAFEAAFHRGDADAISRMYTDDAELLAPEAPTFKGREAIRGAWANVVGSGGNTVRVSTLELQVSGAWIYEIGSFEASAPEGHLLNAGKYIVIWKRQSTGEIKIHRDIFNWDIPPGTSTPGVTLSQ